MNVPKSRILRCAVYTRKSTEEGLEQAFNSLHAQREACEAYVKSQAGEGWTLITTIYDDGGFSGGSMERPALKSLLEQIDKGQVDIVVVYKVDRLTRSLADFAKIVERFDKQGVSFVSVTQAFNTTTSMGRLTLNVLLSFAQFEREVASERIRDKVSASRRKGMWMGGSVPTGYDCVNRKLVPNSKEAEHVRYIFERYCALKSIVALRLALKADGIKSPMRRSKAGVERGGYFLTLGALNHMLRNRVYVGEVAYKGAIYPGQHGGILDRELFDRVQSIMDGNRRRWKDIVGSRMLFRLKGLLFDDNGFRMTPEHTVKSERIRYRYYVSRAITDKDRGPAGSQPRVPAQLIEKIVSSIMNIAVTVMEEIHGVAASVSGTDPDAIPGSLRRVTVSKHSIALTIAFSSTTSQSDTDPNFLEKLSSALLHHLGASCTAEFDREVLRISAPFNVEKKQNLHEIHELGHDAVYSFNQPDPSLLKAIVRANAWLDLIMNGKVASIQELARQVGMESIQARRILKLAFLQPAFVSAVMEGRLPRKITLSELLNNELPNAWAAQQQMLSA
jgi:site-specific DNA recombinase